MWMTHIHEGVRDPTSVRGLGTERTDEASVT